MNVYESIGIAWVTFATVGMTAAAIYFGYHGIKFIQSLIEKGKQR